MKDSLTEDYVIRFSDPGESVAVKKFDICLNTTDLYKIKIMNGPVYRRLECISSTFKQFYLVGRDEHGRTLWTVRERFEGGFWRTLLRLTKLRGGMGLMLEMDGPQGRYLLYRPPGIWFNRNYTLLDSADILRVTLKYGFLRCNLFDHSGQPVGKIRFSNPTLIGRDQGILVNQQGFKVARLIFRCSNFWESRWYSEMEILVYPERWEPVVIAIAAIRLAEKQMR